MILKLLKSSRKYLTDTYRGGVAYMHQRLNSEDFGNMKRFIIAALAVAMLFSFTGCPEASSTSGEGMVQSISAVQKETYVIGEKADPADFTFTGYTSTGATVSIDSADVTFVDELLDAADNSVKVVYGGVQMPMPLSVPAETVTEVTVDASKVVKTTYFAKVSGTLDASIENQDREIDLEGVVVTAKYGTDGEKVIDNALVEATPAAWTASATPVAVTVEFNGDEATGEFNVNIVENNIKSVELKKTEGYVLYSEDSEVSTMKGTGLEKVAYAGIKEGIVELDTDDTVKTPGVYVVATYEGGEVVALAATNVKFQAADGQYTADAGTVTVPTDKASVTVAASYNGADVVKGFTRTGHSVTIDIKEDDIKGVEWTVPTELKASDYSSSDPSGISVAVETLSGEAYTGTAPDYNGKPEATDDNYFTITPADLSKNTIGDLIDLTATAKVNGTTYTKEFSVRMTDPSAGIGG